MNKEIKKRVVWLVAGSLCCVQFVSSHITISERKGKPDITIGKYVNAGRDIDKIMPGEMILGFLNLLD